jgi:acyl-CoA hydrolase
MLPGLPANTLFGGRLVRKLAAVAAVMAVVSISACKKTGDGEYQVEKPVVGTQTDTIHTPTVDVGTQTTTVAVPKVQVKKDSATIKTPTISVKKH